MESNKKCLNDAVHVNAQVEECGDNTPLHNVSGTTGVKEITKRLLYKGADTNLKNDDGKTALNIARQQNTDDGREDVNILETNAKKSSTKTKTSVVKSVKQYKYRKRSGTSGVSGQLYETKLLTVVLFRALTSKEIDKFYLGTNIDGIGALDDLCIRYNNNGEDIMIFVQAKHRNDTKKGKITIQDLWRENGDFSLPKYFDSYLQIRRKIDINNTDIMFTGLYENLKCYFVLYTTVMNDLCDKTYEDEKFTMNNTVKNLINTGENCNIFQYNYGESDIELLTKTILEERVKVMGKKLFEFIEKKKYQMMIKDQDIQSFHVVLAQKVIKVSEVIADYRIGSFREEFFSSNEELLIILKETLYSEALRKTKSIRKDIDELKRSILLDPCADTISKLLGNYIKYDNQNNRLEVVGNKIKDATFGKRLSELPVSPYVVTEAFEIAGKEELSSLNFKLPSSFGNFDLTINKSKIESRLEYLAGKIQDVLISSTDRNAIIDESVVGPNKLLGPGIMDVNGGIGGAVGNLLILDENSKSLKFNMCDESLGPNAKLLFEKLKEKIKDLHTYRLRINIVDFPRISLDADEYDKSYARDFFKNLWFYTFQAKENEIEKIAKKEIAAYCNTYKQSLPLFLIKADAIFSKFHHEVQKWWMLEDEADYLTNNTQSFDNILSDFVDSPMLSFLSFSYINKTEAYGIEFNENAVQYLCLDNIALGLTIIITDVNILSGLKLVQLFKHSNNHNFVNLDYLFSLHEYSFDITINEIRHTIAEVLIILFENISKTNDLERVKCIIDASNNKRAVLITRKDLAVEIEKCLPGITKVKVADERINLTDLTLISQNRLLESKFLFQGEKVKFDAVIDADSRHLMKKEILSQIINNEDIEIGKPLVTSSYNEINEYYVSRSVRKCDIRSLSDNSLFASCESPIIQINTLKDIKGITFILAGPGMGKSTLLTHLSISTKKIDAGVWIERISLDNHWKKIHLKGDNAFDKKAILIFVCKAALTRDSSHVDFEFDIDVIDDKIVLKGNNKMNSLILFELELFIHLYNKGNVIFLFDRIDEIFLCFEEIVPQVLKTISTRVKQQLWLTSGINRYIKGILERGFDATYTLEEVTVSEQIIYFEKYLKRNLIIKKLNREQFECINIFFQYMRVLHDSLERIVVKSCFLHRLYVTAVAFVQNESFNLPLTTDKKEFVEKWNLDTNKLKALNIFAEDEKSDSPRDMYMAVDYFLRRIKLNEFSTVEWDVDLIGIYYSLVISRDFDNSTEHYVIDNI